MKRGLHMSDKEMGDVMAEWNKGVLDSFLIEITRDILYFNDDDGTALVEKILDSAGQKGTGKWTAINALDMGQPVTLIGEAVFARCLSSLKAERTRASTKLDGPTPNFTGDRKEVLDNLEQALYASKIISYAQGFLLMQNVSLQICVHVEIPTDRVVGCQRIRLEASEARNRVDVAWWMYHSLGFPQGYYKSVPCQPRTREFAFRRLFQQGHSQGATRLA